MAAISPRGYPTPLHPLHAILLAVPLPLFFGALLCDLAYSASFHVQWLNFSSWSIVGGLLVGAFTFLWKLIGILRGETVRQGRPLPYQCVRPRDGCLGHDADRSLPLRDRHASSARCSVDRLFGLPCRAGEMMRSLLSFVADDLSNTIWRVTPNRSDPSNRRFP